MSFVSKIKLAMLVCICDTGWLNNKHIIGFRVIYSSFTLYDLIVIDIVLLQFVCTYPSHDGVYNGDSISVPIFPTPSLFMVYM